MTVGSDKSSRKKNLEVVEEKRIPPPDGGYGWIVLAASFVILSFYRLKNSIKYINIYVLLACELHP